jgi:glycosyltransferase involved in cell wall biosynthesis
VKKADIHVHSKHSDHPSEWFLQRIGAAESYTDPETVYDLAIREGMDFVTLTDHNCIRGALHLKKRHPDRVFTGVETTAYFPEDGCKVHVLIYGLDERQFRRVERIRTDIYALRDFLREETLAHSVAHATYSVNGRLTAEHLEKLILLFDVFEAQNGSRDAIHNEGWRGILQDLTPETIQRLRAKHDILPMSETAWIKGFTAGSDDHAGLFVGRTCTLGPARTPEEFLACLKEKKTVTTGRNSNFRDLAFSIYKIAYDFSRSKSQDTTDSFVHQVSSYLFGQDRLGLIGRLKLTHYKWRTGSELNRLLAELVEKLQDHRNEQIDARIDLVYDHVARIADELLRIVVDSVGESLRSGNMEEMFKALSFSFPGILLSVPFLSAFRHLHAEKHLLADLREHLGIQRRKNGGKRLLWFTDTLTDLNGVSITLRGVGWLAHRQGRDLKLVTALLDEEVTREVPPNVVRLPVNYHFELPFYEQVRIKVPSVLSSLKALYEDNPDEILISSPGPLGLLGLVMARLLGAKCTGIYHTDFAAEAARITQDESLSAVVEAYSKWFYSFCHEIRVPTREYMDILELRGYDRAKMSLFPRGIDTDLFAPRSGGIRERLGIGEGVTLLYVGRVSKDKNIGFLADVYERAARRHEDINLLIVGDGPSLPELRARFQGCARVVFAGTVPHVALPEVYSLADLFVFPSLTDTFGMAVLEAQACGLPALVSDVGGPKEIIQDGETGWVLSTDDPVGWERKIVEIAERVRRAPHEYAEIRHLARERVRKDYPWERFMQCILDGAIPANGPASKTKKARPVNGRASSHQPAVQLALY